MFSVHFTSSKSEIVKRDTKKNQSGFARTNQFSRVFFFTGSKSEITRRSTKKNQSGFVFILQAQNLK